MEEKRKVVVVGAGAAGLMAAVTAARAGAQVTVLEAMERPGKKLLLTGNGRCNLTNMDEGLADAYYGSGAFLASDIIRRFDAADVRRFFAQLGLLTQERNGYVYPYSGQSVSVLEVLLTEMRRLKVKLKLTEKTEEIICVQDALSTAENTAKMQKSPAAENKAEIQNGITADMRGCARQEKWLVRTATWQYPADAVILACGSCAMPVTGSDGSGYQLAKRLGHHVISAAPALVPLTCAEPFLPVLAGVRCKAEVSLWNRDTLVRSEAGELQWTKYGVSGIVVFQLSRFVSCASSGESLHLEIDLLPDFERKTLVELLRSRANQLENEKISTLLNGILNDRLIPVILELVGNMDNGGGTGAEITEEAAGGAGVGRLSEKNRKKNEKKNSRKKLVQGGTFGRRTCSELTEYQLDQLVQAMKCLKLTVTGTKSYDVAQICAGGVDAREICPKTLESGRHGDLYFAGEMLDVDGPCGGYNLQWAWSSGYVAGNAAARGKENLSDTE